MIGDRQLLAWVLNGDEAAFTALYRQHQGAIYRFALHMTGSVPAAEDVTQETFLVLLRQGSRYDPSRGTLSAFLYGIARNLVLRRIAQGRDLPLEDSAGGEDLLDSLTRRETIDQVRRAVLSLPAVYREVIALCDLEDASYEDASAALDCPVGTVRSRLNRGRSMLAKKLVGVKGECHV